MPPERQDGAADRYLITGGTGFVGRRVLAALTRRGDQCRSLVRREGGGPDTIRADLADKTALTAACYGIESIFHCAGYAHAFSSLSGDDAAMHWRVNFEGTRNLVEAAGQAGVKRFVFLSSVKAMAESGDVCADEDFPGDPGSAYGHAKRAAENAVLDAGQRYGVHVVNLRLAMVYGAGEGILNGWVVWLGGVCFLPYRKRETIGRWCTWMMLFRRYVWLPRMTVRLVELTLLRAQKPHPGVLYLMLYVRCRDCRFALGRYQNWFCVRWRSWGMAWRVF